MLDSEVTNRPWTESRRLVYSLGESYTWLAFDTTGAGIDSPNHASAWAAQAAFFMRVCHDVFFYGQVVAGKPRGLPGACVTGLSTPLRACPPV